MTESTTTQFEQVERTAIFPQIWPFLDFLDRIGCGGAIIVDQARVVALNRTAKRIIDEELGDCAQSRSTRERLSWLLPRSTQEACTLVQRHSGRPLAIQTLTPRRDHANDCKVILLVDTNLSHQPRMAILRMMFGLTPSEAKLAVEISRGSSPAKFAAVNGVKIATVRSQLAAVFAKTQTDRQAELVSLLARVSVLA